MKILFRPQFWFDLEEGVAYLAENASSDIASSWHDEVMATVKKIECQPDLGRIRLDLRPDGIRSLVLRRYPRYLLFYRLDGNTIEVLRIKHGMMNLPPLFDPPRSS